MYALAVFHIKITNVNVKENYKLTNKNKLSQVEPSWRMLDQVITDLVQPGMLGDSLPTSQPLTTHVETRAEIIAKFSGLTYSKGKCNINEFIIY